MPGTKIGFSCPQCGAVTIVCDSRPARLSIKRRRLCPACRSRFTTYEIPAEFFDGGSPFELLTYLDSLITLMNPLIESAKRARDAHDYMKRAADSAKALSVRAKVAREILS